ncbi:MBL fold metallo-hydrolase [Spirosoma fluviale]|uniref:Glyoxylase, beta-lactamase superfamily II n=1 Tax=Spirosoma fluviale TaxID=1597977 RepID=A0A286GUM7_9BACT|nr:MBL fold metallo-hydrolase [Spirosoma fluviale]SOD99182.1 Glyoxylase, beta-lactamase superfamily II [Spirosoma fluviale]
MKTDLILYPLKVSSSTIINNCYVVINRATKQALIIDPAWELAKIEQVLSNEGASVSAILLTHSHNDHVNLADELARRYGCRVFMGADEIKYYTFSCPFLTAIHREEQLPIAGFSISPIFTPGHTHGSVCYLLDDVLFSGDTLFIEGCGQCTDQGADPRKLFLSLQKLKKRLRPSTIVYPGHSFIYETGKAMSSLMNHNIYMQIEDCDLFVKFRMRKAQANTLVFK